MTKTLLDFNGSGCYTTPHGRGHSLIDYNVTCCAIERFSKLSLPLTVNEYLRQKFRRLRK